MNIIFNYLAIFFTAISLHELGHIIAYLSFGYNPNIKIMWWRVLIGDKIIENIRLVHLFIIYLSGILGGYLYLLIYNYDNWLIIYFLMCIISIMGIFNIMGVPKEYFGKTVKD